MSVCANCSSSEGPFYRVWKERDSITPTPPLCKNTMRAQDRITKCVERRTDTDNKKYKELMDTYAVS